MNMDDDENATSSAGAVAALVDTGAGMSTSESSNSDDLIVSEQPPASDDGATKTSSPSLSSSQPSSQEQHKKQQEHQPEHRLLSPEEYLKWGRSLVGRDWEIYWNDEEDAAVGEEKDEEDEEMDGSTNGVDDDEEGHEDEEDQTSTTSSNNGRKVLYKDDFMDDPLEDDDPDHQESGAKEDLGKDDDDWNPNNVEEAGVLNNDDEEEEEGEEESITEEEKLDTNDQVADDDKDEEMKDAADSQEYPNNDVQNEEITADPSKNKSSEQPMMVTRRTTAALAASASDEMEIDKDIDERMVEDGQEEKDGNENNNEEEDQDDGGSEGSIWSDWYDAKVLELIEPDGSVDVITANLVFKVLFVGDDEVYDVALVPSKVRPSARAWIKRTTAILRPSDNNSTPTSPSKAATTGSTSKKKGKTTKPTELPPDTRTVDDEKYIVDLKKQFGISPGNNPPPNRSSATSYWADECRKESDKLPSALIFPTPGDLDHIRELRGQLQAQIYLRNKLSKIESVEGEAKFVDGVRNPSEPYCNALIQCCKDVDQACSWFENAWKLMDHIFKMNRPQNESEAERSDLLSINDLVNNYIESGLLSITNAASIDVHSAVVSSKRKQPTCPSTDASPSRRTKRRRNPGTAEGTGPETIEADPSSSEYVDYQIESILRENTTWYMEVLTMMLRAISSMVLKPVVEWKSEASLILGEDNLPHSHDCVAVKKLRHDEDDQSGTEERDQGNSGKTKDEERKDTNDCVDIEDDGSDDDDDDDEEEEVLFSYEQIQACLSAVDENPVLSSYNFSDYIEKLRSKLKTAEKTESKAKQLFSRLSEQVLSDVSKPDPVWVGLDAIEILWDDVTSPIGNVHPLGAESDSPVIYNELRVAVDVRKWLVDTERARLLCERKSFVDGLLSQIQSEDLPDIQSLPVVCRGPDIEQKWKAAKQFILNLCKQIRPFQELALEHERRLDELICQGVDVPAIEDSLRNTLKQFSDCPALLPIQEKIAACLDIALWQVKADVTLKKDETKSLDFDEIRLVFEWMEKILVGKGETRLQYIMKVVPDDNTDRQIRDFARKVCNAGCTVQVESTSRIYKFASSWKERADSILLALRAYGNGFALDGHPTLPQRKQTSVNRVDIRRIDDLLTEYESCMVSFTSHVDVLTKVQTETNAWSEKFVKGILDWDWATGDCLAFVETQQSERPNAMLMDPSRSVVDSLVNLLTWHKKLRQVTKYIIETSNSLNPAELSFSVVHDAYPLLADGTTALEIYTEAMVKSIKGTDRLKPDQSAIVSLLDTNFNVRKSGRAVDERLQSIPLLSSVFSSMISYDEQYGKPLETLSWFYWNLLVAEFVAPWVANDIPKKALQSGVQVQTLNSAKELKASNPFHGSKMLEMNTSEALLLDEIIEKAELCETSTKFYLAQKKEIFRNASTMSDKVQGHLTSLRQCLDEVKLRSSGQEGVAVNPELENRLTKDVAIFSWMERALAYPILFLDEVSFSSLPVEGRHQTSRIPFDVLCTLSERMPYTSENEPGSAYTLACMRIKELYAAANTWAEEVTKLTMISNRGSKRRQQTLAANSDEEENDDVQLLQKDKMELLAQNPVIAKVKMPREEAVENMVKHSQDFEENLHAFLLKDYSGMDKMAYPTGASLLGKDSEFTLFRLTRNPVFFSMTEAMENLAQIASDVFAETKGKAAFDWMKTAVDWIMSLEEAVCRDSPFPDPRRLLVIPAKRAKELYIEAEEIFLQPPTDAVQILSAHGIFLSTSAQRRDFQITVKKDGAHHSVGSVVMMWCPILFSSLRHDLKRLDAWEEQTAKLVADFNYFITTINPEEEYDRTDISYKLYQYGHQARTALENGHSSLVVVPATSSVNAIMSIWNTSEEWREQNSSNDLNSQFAQEYFTRSADLFPNRFGYLDALLHRRALWDHVDDRTQSEEIESKNGEERPFTEIFQASLEAAFLKTATTLCLEGSDCKNLCILKAVEISSVMFDRYENNMTEFGAKARSLRSNLQNNIDLCVSVICGDITATALVKMTPEQLASQKAKTARLAAKEAAMKDTLLTEGRTAKKESEVVFKKPSTSTHNPPPHTAKPAGGILKSRTFTSSPSSGGNAATGMLSSYRDSDSDDDDDDADGAPTLDDDDLPLASHTSTSKSMKERSTKPPPPPPPSLASTLTFNNESSSPPKAQYDSGEDEEDDVNDCDQRVESRNGKDKFRLKIHGKKQKHSFNVALYLEDTSKGAINGFLPNNLVQKGRIKSNDLKNFLIEKSSRGTWSVFSLRIEAISDDDEMLYRSFCNEFESIERISMFELDDEVSKVFLVCPKFHEAAEGTDLVSFSSSSSTYAIVLTKALK